MREKRRLILKLVASFGVLTLLSLIVLLSVVVVWRGYIAVTPRSRICPIRTLVLDASPFPPGASAGTLLSPAPRGPLEFESSQTASRAIYLRGGIAVYSVFRYRTAARAAEEFRWDREVKFTERSAGPGGLPALGPWNTPTELTYRSPIAQQFYVGCGPEGDVPTCRMIARYAEYYVYLNVQMSAANMTIEALEDVLRAIDDKMAGCLGRIFL
jgi:hypothetical protein